MSAAVGDGHVVGSDVAGVLGRPPVHPRPTDHRGATWFRFSVWGIAVVAVGGFIAFRRNRSAYNDHRSYPAIELSLRQWVIGIVATAALVGLFVGFYVSWRRANGLVLYWYLAAVEYWGLCHAQVALAFGVEPHSRHEWLSTAWYWSLDPAPIDIAGPLGWTAPVTDASGLGGFALVGLQAYSVLLVITGAGLLVKTWRDSSSAKDEERGSTGGEPVEPKESSIA